MMTIANNDAGPPEPLTHDMPPPIQHQALNPKFPNPKTPKLGSSASVKMLVRILAHKLPKFPSLYYRVMFK